MVIRVFRVTERSCDVPAPHSALTIFASSRLRISLDGVPRRASDQGRSHDTWQTRRGEKKEVTMLARGWWNAER
jgi:hypothetical protein